MVILHHYPQSPVSEKGCQEYDLTRHARLTSARADRSKP